MTSVRESTSPSATAPLSARTAKVRPSPEVASPSSGPWPASPRARICPEAASQKATVPSRPAEMSRAPSEVNDTALTAPSWPRSRWIRALPCGSHNPTVPSPEAVAMRFPSGEKATALISPSWEPITVPGGCAGISQTRSTPSLPPAASWLPSGENATACCGAAAGSRVICSLDSTE